ncbi:MAG: hypothetical protein ABJZ55_14585 [Fuerstiella sp.]
MTNRPRRIAILASDSMWENGFGQQDYSRERDEQMGKLVPAFADRGLKLELIRWREATEKGASFDALLPLFVWDYFEGNEADFVDQVQRAAQKTTVLNSPDLIVWNADKSYLEELKHKGAAVIPTVTVSKVDQEVVQSAFAKFNSDQLVIKPQVGGGAWRQVLLNRTDKLPDPTQLPPGEALIQPFLPSVVEEGEYSLIFFGGQFSHALVKRPKSGDYRIQAIHGGTETAYQPTTAEQTAAASILKLLPELPLYARVDLLRGVDSELKLIEVELIEPYLYLPYAPGQAGQNLGAKNLAKALSQRLS